jgi:opacity protein-like surface antigen
MRRLWIVWAAVVFCWGPGVRLVAADISLGAMGSYLDTDSAGEAWGGGLRLKYDLTEYIGMDFRGSFLRLEGSGVNLFPVEANLLAQFPIANRILPYGGFGVGYYFFEGGDLRLEDRVGFGPLAGLELRLTSGFAIFGEARWLFLEPKLSGGGSVRMDSFGINAGLMFLF